ncbi:MAG: FadR/GntR family transcriptional regulator [Candidatus Solibacter sp.]
MKRQKADVTARLLAIFKQLISEGTLVQGARLPAERDLATNLKVSRGSLRQALKMLEVMGVVSQRVGDGTYLNGAAPSILAEPMEFLILMDGISMAELMDARLIVEPELAARAAQRWTPPDLAALHDSISRMMECGDRPGELIAEDLRFHRTIFRMAENRVCSVMFTIVHQSMHKLVEITSQMVHLDHTVRLHTRIYNAIRKRDPVEAKARMFAHLTDARKLLLQSQKAARRRPVAKRKLNAALS